MKLPSVCACLIAAAVAFVLVFGNLSIYMMLVSAGAAAVVYSITSSLQYATGSAIVALFTMAGLMRYGVIKKEGFNVYKSPTEIADIIKKIVKEGFVNKDEEEEFMNKEDDEEGFMNKDDEEEFMNKDDEEGFMNKDDEEEFMNKDDEEGFMNKDDEEEFMNKGDEEEGFRGYEDEEEMPRRRKSSKSSKWIGVGEFAGDRKNSKNAKKYRSRKMSSDRSPRPGRVNPGGRFQRSEEETDGYMYKGYEGNKKNKQYKKSSCVEHDEEYEDEEEDRSEGFMSQVFQNISKGGYTSPGFGMAAPLVEGFEDEKKAEKKGKPAPTIKKEEMAMPFKLGEIPSQVKNGPHIDAGSTLIKAIQGLNPDQINAMTKDTKQLIETQKSLMGMLGTMKPMMNDGKELMETFQQMFGEGAAM